MFELGGEQNSIQYSRCGQVQDLYGDMVMLSDLFCSLFLLIFSVVLFIIVGYGDYFFFILPQLKVCLESQYLL